MKATRLMAGFVLLAVTVPTWGDNLGIADVTVVRPDSGSVTASADVVLDPTPNSSQIVASYNLPILLPGSPTGLTLLPSNSFTVFGGANFNAIPDPFNQADLVYNDDGGNQTIDLSQMRLLSFNFQVDSTASLGLHAAQILSSSPFFQVADGLGSAISFSSVSDGTIRIVPEPTAPCTNAPVSRASSSSNSTV